MVKEKDNIKPDTSSGDEGIKEIAIEDEIADKKVSQKKKPKKSRNTKDKNDEKIHQLEEEVKIAEDKYLRLYSDFDNYRKRTARERIELNKTASAEIIGSLLSVLDDFERAQKAMNEVADTDAIKEGVGLIYNKLSDLLKQKGLEEINCIGEEFNTDFHEAITKIPAESDEMKGKILDQIEKGYLLNGTILRYPKVVVGS